MVEYSYKVKNSSEEEYGNQLSNFKWLLEIWKDSDLTKNYRIEENKEDLVFTIKIEADAEN